ncbi:MAG: aminoglycoside adenylyltransferase [Bacillales bacterium]|nr:aminoglycoside adenylyltransferase [Bacillales bacterium]
MKTLRSEKEMFNLILSIAIEDQRVRAVYMNGSRANPNVKKDIFQDYDIVYVVTETASFINDEKWICVFGDLLMMQQPDRNDKSIGIEVNIDKSYGYLMLFKDGNRIDLRIESIHSIYDTYGKDKLTIPLLDKDNILPIIGAPTDSDYYVKAPTEAEYLSCCNDFWWCLQNVAKGIWRDELPYAKQMFELVIRARLDQMVSWWIGMNNNFQVSSGKMGKYFKNYLQENYWNMYKQTYSDSNYENMWDSVFVACELFRSLAIEVADKFSYNYPFEDDKAMHKYLKRVKEL